MPLLGCPAQKLRGYGFQLVVMMQAVDAHDRPVLRFTDRAADEGRRSYAELSMDTLTDARQIPLLLSWIVAVRVRLELKRPEGGHMICHSLLFM